MDDSELGSNCVTDYLTIPDGTSSAIAATTTVAASTSGSRFCGRHLNPTSGEMDDISVCSKHLFRPPYCLKITQNVAFGSFNFGLFHRFLSGNTVWSQAPFSKNRQIDFFFGISNELLSTQNVNVARFARNVEWNFLCDFQTPWSFLHTYSLFHFFPGRAYPFRVSVLTDENEVNIILKYLHDFHLQNHPFCFRNVVPPMKTCARMKLPLPLILVALLALLSIMSKPPVNLSSNL